MLPPTARSPVGRVLLAVLLGPAIAGAAPAYICNGGDIPHCYPVVGEVELVFDRQFQGTYRPGEPYDVVTVVPNGTGESLASVGITLRVQLVCSCPGVGAIAGIPAGEMGLFSSSLATCALFTASHDTDADGFTEFTGTLRSGGCSENLHLFVDGQFVATLPIRINSPDSTPPVGVDGSDLAALAERFGLPARYDICFDFNEDGAVDAGDLAAFAAALGASCE